MRHGSLFSGIGGFDLAAGWMGWENVFHCEIDKFCQKILKYYWPHAELFEDIKKTDFSNYKNKIDIITGGFPCQPYSAAGRRKGKADDRHLWPEMLRAVREIQPRWVVGENVYGIVNWSRGLVFDEVQIDLENEGYEVTPFLLPACGKDAPHKRERVWFIAYRKDKNGGLSIGKEKKNSRFGSNGYNGVAANPYSDGCNGGNSEYEINSNERGFNALTESRGLQKRYAEQLGESKQNEDDKQFSGVRDWQDFPTQSAVYSRDDGLSYGLDTETISIAKWRTESIKGFGNAVVPQIPYEIFKAIEQFENKQKIV